MVSCIVYINILIYTHQLIFQLINNIPYFSLKKCAYLKQRICIFIHQVNQTKRSGLNVDVQFQVFENNATVPPTQAKATYDKLSVPYLQTRLGYQVYIFNCALIIY